MLTRADPQVEFKTMIITTFILTLIRVNGEPYL
jgi:hypothetical protein